MFKGSVPTDFIVYMNYLFIIFRFLFTHKHIHTIRGSPHFYWHTKGWIDKRVVSASLRHYWNVCTSCPLATNGDVTNSAHLIKVPIEKFPVEISIGNCYQFGKHQGLPVFFWNDGQIFTPIFPPLYSQNSQPSSSSSSWTCHPSSSSLITMMSSSPSSSSSSSSSVVMVSSFWWDLIFFSSY